MLILKKNPKIFLYYIVGNYRYCAYFNKYFKWLLRKKVQDSIKALNSNLINRECLNSASCKDCGCQVPQQNYGGKPCNCFWVNLKGNIKTKEDEIPNNK